jgi:hypothetical protein
MSNEVTTELILRLAEVADLSIPEEDLEPLVAAFRGYRKAFRPLEELVLTGELALTGVDPMLTMDPRWAS